MLKSIPQPARACRRDDLEALARFVLEREKVQGAAELTLDRVGHRRIRMLNRRFRGVDRTTDVIAFRNAGVPQLHGDIAINVPQAARQAKEAGHPLRREIRLLWIHGILHLLGYTDYQPAPRRRMWKRQTELLRVWEKRHP